MQVFVIRAFGAVTLYITLNIQMLFWVRLNLMPGLFVLDLL